MLTDAQIDRVQSSFADVLPIAEAAGMMFYERIFTLAPEARALFGDDIAAQARRTMAAVKTAVDGLRTLDEVAPFLVRLGARHVGYGVVPEHFDVVGAALMWTLERGLGEKFTPAVAEAWGEVWQIIVDTMLEGMRLAAPAMV
jgi:hemoglobin-like flavoprotein